MVKNAGSLSPTPFSRNKKRSVLVAGTAKKYPLKGCHPLALEVGDDSFFVHNTFPRAKYKTTLNQNKGLMGFFRNLFGTAKQSTTETSKSGQRSDENTSIEGSILSEKEKSRQEKQSERQADTLKFDAIRAMRVGELRFALSALEKSLELSTQFETRYYYSEALLMAGNKDEALRQMGLLLDEEPNHLPTLLSRGRLLLEMDHYAESLSDVDKALAIEATLEPDKEDLSHYQLSMIKARALRSLERYEEAISLLNSLFDLYLERGQILLLKAEIEISANLPTEADKSLQQAVELLPEEERVPLLMAQLAQSSYNHEAAIRYYEQALNLNPFCIEALVAKARLRSELGNTDAAIRDLLEAKEGMAPSRDLLQALIELYNSLGNIEEVQNLEKELSDEKFVDTESGKNNFDNLYSGGIY